ncbi:GerMN domain-containing protein [Geomesophilobacter sediminis]|uniref:GerMN domain-containing protein n=1 Tax=Geomesophilobacter sediminis TaxID=2798584 RepID=A0A8J7SCL7_9BACT|nr:GerMN domain-containing protein [Geomesophilobacter sediminis]MBJ6727259.1 GerMN domain-containing protein [Geomesophilobacter sediminis]
MKRLMYLVVVALLALAATSCRRDGGSGERPVPVSATPAYEKYFGSAPSSTRGECFAFVIYFPSGVEKGKLVPFPFFSFDKPTLKKVAVERLVTGMEIPAYRGELLNPFPPGTHLLALSERNGLVTLEMSNQGPSDRVLRQAGREALALTLKQFAGVKTVDLIRDGDRTRLKLPAEAAVREPGPPRLLSVVANKGKGRKTVEEVSVLFDRPLKIRELVLTDGQGKGFPGELFHSVFDMAAVLKPREPARFQAGMPLRVRWKVVDRKGREGKGDTLIPLQVHEQ